MTETVFDLSEFEAKQIHKGPACSLAMLRLSDAQRAKLDQALLADHIRHATIVAVLSDWGFAVNAQNISRHRRGIKGESNGCLCEPPQ